MNRFDHLKPLFDTPQSTVAHPPPPPGQLWFGPSPAAMGYEVPPQYTTPSSGSTFVCTPHHFGSADFGAYHGGMAERFMGRFWFEDRDSVPDEEFYSPGEPRVPNTMVLVKRFLKQVRESKGYDVDCKPPRMFDTPFMPLDLERAKTYDSGRYYEHSVLGSATFAVGKINELTGLNYKLVEIVKAVRTSTTLLYLTFTAARELGCSSNVETFQALVEVPYGPYQAITLELVEWRRKPDACTANSTN